VLAVLLVVTPSNALAGAVGIFELVLTLGIAAIVAFGILDQGEVNAQSVTGAVCVYLLLGLAFTFVYGALAALDSGPLFVQGTDGTLALRLYYSYITLTTVGYGDYTLVSNLGHMLAVIEALAGQLYLVTVVALLIARIRPGGTEQT
jgi:Ion channel